MTKREKLGRKIVILQELLDKWREEWKQLPAQDA